MADGATLPRFRRSRHLVGFWRGRWFFLHNYATGRESLLPSATPAVLDFFDGWRTVAAFARHAKVSRRTAQQHIASLLHDGVLESSADRRAARVGTALTRWNGWNPSAGFFHSATRDAYYDDPFEGEQQLREKAQTVRVPPRVKRYPGARRYPLPGADASSAFAQVLLRRRTWRQFSKAPLSQDALSSLLGLTGGIHQWAQMDGQPELPLKTSPSGGSRHPIEIYVWARRVVGLPAGLYHYACDRHQLELVKAQRSRMSVERYLPTQFWYEGAPALVFFTAVYERYQWKYGHARAYRAALIEAGHQCQTFCLAATSLQLAPFCAMALADSAIEGDLGLDGISEAVLYAAGVGVQPPGGRVRAMPAGRPAGGARPRQQPDPAESAMTIQLERIDFDHAPLTGVGDSLSVRINASTPAPPWMRSGGVSKAAYALAPLALAAAAGQPPTIRATFSFDPTLPVSAASVKVRAVALAGTTPSFGAVDATAVPVPVGSVGTTAPIAFAMPSAATVALHVGRYDVSWQWQVQLTPSGPWLNFDRSDHTIYVTVDLPQAPWLQAPDAPHQTLWPWTEVLDWACQWAHGVKITSTTDVAATAAARKIEHALFDLGGRADVPFEYYGLTQYTPSDSGVGQFFLTDFLALLAGKPPADRRGVNCTDCAAAVVTFANALGCGLTLHRIRRTAGFGFDTNPTVKIGGASPTRDFFGQHDVAIRSAASAPGHHVYDACLMTDHDSNPASAKSATLALARGAARGDFAAAPLKQYKYIHRLIARNDWGNCEGVDLSTPCLDSCIDPQPASPPLIELWHDFRLQIDALAAPAGPASLHEFSVVPVHIAGFTPYERILQPVNFAVLRGLVDQSVEFLYVATNADGEDERLAVAIGSASSPPRARDALAWVLTQSDRRPTAIETPADTVGDVAFANEAIAAQFFVRGTTLVSVRSIGRSAVPLTPIAKALDAIFKPTSVVIPARVSARG